MLQDHLDSFEVKWGKLSQIMFVRHHRQAFEDSARGKLPNG